MSQKLPINNFEWIADTSQFREDSIKNHNKVYDKEYFLEVDLQHPKKLHELHDDLLFLPERIKIENVYNLITNFHDKIGYVNHIKNLKQS